MKTLIAISILLSLSTKVFAAQESISLKLILRGEFLVSGWNTYTAAKPLIPGCSVGGLFGGGFKGKSRDDKNPLTMTPSEGSITFTGDINKPDLLDRCQFTYAHSYLRIRSKKIKEAQPHYFIFKPENTEIELECEIITNPDQEPASKVECKEKS